MDYTTQFGKGVTYTVGTDDYSKVWDYEMLGAGTWTVNFNLTKAAIGNITPGNSSDAVVRLGSHGAFWDTPLTFDASLLKAGANTLTIEQTGGGATLEWDYLRLEADGTGT